MCAPSPATSTGSALPAGLADGAAGRAQYPQGDRVDDTGTAANFSPVLRIQAHDFDGTETPFIFPSGDPYYILNSGNGTHEIGVKYDWNPANIVNLNHLLVRVQNGTTDQGTSCFEERRIYNWARIAYKNAVSKEGASYEWGVTGPAYDCSGLVVTSYNAVANFPGLGDVRTAQQIYDWARTHLTGEAVRQAYSAL